MLVDDYDEQLPGDLLPTLAIFVVAPVLAGRVVRDRARLQRALREKAARHRTARAREAERAALDERERIAGDLHDIVAHALSGMVVQAAGAHRLARRDPERAREALRAVEDSGRDALTELRLLLGVLRREDEELALAPQPSLRHVEALARRSAAEGLPVDLTVEGEPAELPAGVDVTAYRVVQQALGRRARPARAGRAAGDGALRARRRRARGARRRRGRRSRPARACASAWPSTAASCARPAGATAATSSAPGCRWSGPGERGRRPAPARARPRRRPHRARPARARRPRAGVRPRHGGRAGGRPARVRHDGARRRLPAPRAPAHDRRRLRRGDRVRAGGVGPADVNGPFLALLVLAFTAGQEAEPRRAGTALAAMVAGVLGVAVASGSALLSDYVFPVGFVVATWIAARALQTRATLAAELHEAAVRAEEERAADAARAAAEERRRIAREMHDVVAHSVSVMVVQAGGARRILDRDPERAAEAAALIERTGRLALAEMRLLLGVLHTDQDGEPHLLEPQPTLDGIEALVARAREAGLPVALRVHGERRPLPAGAEVAVYRVAQEALTNAIKHATGAPAAVVLAWTDDALELTVADTGTAVGTRGCRAAATG
jgi:signal transduction histidine kinase